MKFKRVITADGKSGVSIQTDLIDTEKTEFLSNIGGFDQVPDLPLRPEQVFGEYKKLGIFGPLGAIRFDLFTIAPEGAGTSELERAAKIDLGTGAGMTPGKEGDGMHRTDSIDFVIVLDGETNVAYPGEDGKAHEITVKAGDFLVHNGIFHAWHNRSKKNCTVLFVIAAAERKTP